MKIPGIAAFMSIFLSGCAAAPVTQQTQRNYDGFSIVPPQEQGWVALATNDRQVRFQKKSASDTHKMYLGVSRRLPPKAFISREEFLQYVNDSYFIVDPHFQEILVKEASLNPKHGDYCVEYRYKVKNFKTPRSKNAAFMLHEGHCYLCLHPNAKDREYNVCYSEIFAPGEEDMQYRVAGDAFIDSIQFTEPSGAKQRARDLISVSAELLDNKNRVYFVSQLPYNPLFPLRIELDGKKILSLSSGEVATIKLHPGKHSVTCSFSWTGTEISFEMIHESAKYFLVREPLPPVKLTSGKWGPEVLEVPEADWKYIAVDPTGRVYRGQ